jgi:hypothetical protein
MLTLCRMRLVVASGAAALAATLAGCAPEAPVAIAVDTLASPAPPGSGEPNLTVDGRGRVFLSWIERLADSTAALRMAALDGDRWSEARTIAADRNLLVNWADFPSLRALPDGRLAAHWMIRTGTRGFTYDFVIAQSLDEGRTWTAPVMPHRDGTAAEHGFAALYSGADGAVGAAWLDGRRYAITTPGAVHEMILAHTTVSGAGALGHEDVLDPRVCDCCQTSLAVASSGPVLVYRDRSPTDVRDIAIVRQVDGAWGAPATVHADGWEIKSCPVNGPAVAARNDAVAVAWFTGARDSARVLVAFSSDAGASFGRPIRVDQGNPAGRVDVELDPSGAAVVSWIERPGGDTAQVRLRRVRPDGAAEAPVIVGVSSAARAAGFPRMAARGEELILAWTIPGSPSLLRVARARLSAPR